MADINVDFLGFTGDLFPEKFVTVPPQPTEKKPGQLSQEQVKEYFEKGYLIIDDFFTEEELDPCKDSLADLVDGLANKLYKAGKVKDLYADLDFYKRLTRLNEDFPGANVMLHKGGVLPEALQKVWTNERLLNVIEQLIGPDIAGNPLWNIRPKTPQAEAMVVPWHQDAAYSATDIYNVLVPTAWIPLINATSENGCMQFTKRGHRKGMVAHHECCYAGTWYVMMSEEVMEKELGVDLEEDVQTCEIPYKGMLLFHNLIPHRSLPNMSENIRWSMDFRWQKPSEPYGFWNIKDGVVFRNSKNPEHDIDWDSFMKIDRDSAQTEFCGAEKDEFDTTITGPWMRKWEITNDNKHTEKMVEEMARLDENNRQYTLP